MKKLLYKSKVGLLGCLFVLALFSSLVFLPAVGAAQTQYAADWKYLINRDFVNDLAIHEGTVWQGVNGGLIARSIAGPGASRFFNKLNSGLEAVQILSVAVDDRGNVWVGTGSGAFRRSVNGEWITYNRDNSPFTVNTVRVVTPDQQGGVWFGTWLGGAYYLNSQDEWTEYNTQNSGITGNRIAAIVPDDAGGVWFGTDSRGAAYLDEEGEWTAYRTINSPLPTNDVQDILIDDTGRVWFATMSGLVYLERGSTLVVENGENGEADETVQANGEDRWEIFDLLNSSIPSEIVNSLALDQDGNLWMGTNGGVATLRNVAGGGTWLTYTTENSFLPASVVRSVAIDRNGMLWVGTWGGGIAGLHPKTNSWSVYRQGTLSLNGRISLPSNTVNKILSLPEGDSIGKVLFATSGGVASYDGPSDKWETFNASKRLPANQVNGMAVNGQGNIAYATDGGGLAVKSATGAWSYYNVEESDIPSDDLVDVSYDSGGGIWVVTVGGRAAYLSAAGDWTVYDPASDELPAGEYRLNSVYNDGAGNTWFGTWGGGALQRNSTGVWTAHKARTGGLPANDVSRIMSDTAGNTWFGTWGGGVARLNSGGNWDVFNMGNSELRSDIIRDLVIDSRGWVWTASPQGAAYYDGTGWTFLRARDSGLPVNSIWNLASDTLGNVWFSTNENGVAVYNPGGVTVSLARLTDITELEKEVIILYGGKHLESDVAPIIADSSLLMPMRPLATALGAVLDWDGDAGKVEMTLGEKIVVLHINDTRAYVNGELQTLDVPARIHQSRTMVPVRFITENLGLNVTWDSSIRAVLLTNK